MWLSGVGPTTVINCKRGSIVVDICLSGTVRYGRLSELIAKFLFFFARVVLESKPKT